MKEIIINSSIFPIICGTGLNDIYGNPLCYIDLPRGGNLIYLKQLEEGEERELLSKYCNSDIFTDDDYRKVINLALKKEKSLKSDNDDVAENEDSVLKLFGLEMIESEEGIQYSIKDSWITEIRSQTWECIVLDLLKSKYNKILNKYNFDNIQISLSSYRTHNNRSKQAVCSALRTALIYTLVSYLYGDYRGNYENFDTFFEIEFSNRISFLHNMWKSNKEDLKYIPVFDSFYNLSKYESNELIAVIQKVLIDNDVLIEDKEVLLNTLTDSALRFHNKETIESKDIEKQVIKPFINYVVELQSANKDLYASRLLFDQNFYGQSVNRSYYAMMHGLKALLEEKKQLSDWEPKRLNVKEDHKQLEQKLRRLVKDKEVSDEYLELFKDVKKYRWQADYNVMFINQDIARECLNNATNFVDFINTNKTI